MAKPFNGDTLMTLLAILFILVCWAGVRWSGVSGNAFEQYALNQYINGQNLKWDLYTNNHTPVQNDSLSNYTILSASGYAQQQSNGGGWTLTNLGTQYQAAYPNLTFTWTGAATVYGIVCSTSSGTFVGAELFTSGPFTFPSGSNSFVYTPNWFAQ